jgi:hypothetical protein
MHIETYGVEFLLSNLGEKQALKNSKAIVTTLVAISTIGVVLTVLAYGLIVSTKTLPSSGTIVSTVNVDAYSDSACTQTLASIDWGTIPPGGFTSKTVYVKNTGDAPVTLSMSKANWTPATANGPLTVTWNREGTVLPANQVSAAALTLSASSNVGGLTTFSVDIVISGTG